MYKKKDQRENRFVQNCMVYMYIIMLGCKTETEYVIPSAMFIVVVAFLYFSFSVSGAVTDGI